MYSLAALAQDSDYHKETNMPIYHAYIMVQLEEPTQAKAEKLAQELATQICATVVKVVPSHMAARIKAQREFHLNQCQKPGCQAIWHR